MKLIFAGLMLLHSTITVAQTRNAVYHQPQEKLTIEKMRAVILADEQQHEAKGPIVLTGYSDFKSYQSLTNRVGQHKYVRQKYNPWLERMGYGLTLLKSLSPYNNSSNTDHETPHQYYRAPEYPVHK